jgi:hypothetical protein
MDGREMTTPVEYHEFLHSKTQVGADTGFEPVHIPDFLFDFQRSLVEWAVRKGRAAIFADCGLGKTAMQLVWAENVLRKTGESVLILTPLAVGAQTVREAHKFGIEAEQSRDGTFKTGIVVTNYEKLHLFDSSDFGGVVCDESSILKNYAGATRAAITAFMHGCQYRLLATATPAPNDWVELGTSSEALGYLRRVEMLAMHFTHDGGDTQKWRLRGHAQAAFWRWMATWARALRRPSDIGGNDGSMVLPPLHVNEVVVKSSKPLPGTLFVKPAETLAEQRAERRATLTDRCERVASIMDHDQPGVAWCHLNDESALLAKLINGAESVSGADSDERKEEVFGAFARGDVRVLVTKPSIAGFGLNWQHCAHQTFFPSHSFEQYYQAVRRSWRFGQDRAVTVDLVTSEGEAGVLANMQRKQRDADAMFASMVAHMTDAAATSDRRQLTTVEAPAWM